MKPLTRRQAKVLELICEGYTNAQIGTLLHRNENTIGKHVFAIYERTGARNRAHAAAMWASGLVKVKEAA